MCGKKLKVFLLSLVLVSLSCAVQSFSFCYAEVRLTDEEAEKLMSEIQESQKELNQVKTELRESKRESQELKMELEDVKNTYSEQKTYYEEQLTEAEKKEKIAVSIAIGGVTASVTLLGVLVIVLLL